MCNVPYVDQRCLDKMVVHPFKAEWTDEVVSTAKPIEEEDNTCLFLDYNGEETKESEPVTVFSNYCDLEKIYKDEDTIASYNDNEPTEVVSSDSEDEDEDDDEEDEAKENEEEQEEFDHVASDLEQSDDEEEENEEDSIVDGEEEILENMEDYSVAESKAGDSESDSDEESLPELEVVDSQDIYRKILASDISFDEEELYLFDIISVYRERDDEEYNFVLRELFNEVYERVISNYEPTPYELILCMEYNDKGLKIVITNFYDEKEVITKVIQKLLDETTDGYDDIFELLFLRVDMFEEDYLNLVASHPNGHFLISRIFDGSHDVRLEDLVCPTYKFAEAAQEIDEN